MKTTRILAYDISNNKKRNKLAKYLEKKGKRLQKSLFLLQVSTWELKKILEEVAKIVGKDEEIALFTLCHGCENKAFRLGAEWPKCYL